MQPHEVREVEIKFQPLGRTVRVAAGSRLMEAALEAGAVLDLPCGGEGVCGKCRVRVCQGAAEPGPCDRTAISRDDLAQGFRLACQTIVYGPMTVEVPATSLLSPFHQILARTEGAPGPVAEPLVRHVYRELPPPDRDGGQPAACYGVAMDVGTTTLVAMLLDLETGEELAIASRVNPQTAFGDDVLTRILHAGRSAEGLEELRRAAVGAADEMIGELADRAGSGPRADLRADVLGEHHDAAALGRHRSPVPGRGALRPGHERPDAAAGVVVGASHPSSRHGLRFAGDRRLCRRRHGERHPGHRTGRDGGACAVGRYRHQRRDRAGGRRKAHGRLDRRRVRPSKARGSRRECGAAPGRSSGWSSTACCDPGDRRRPPGGPLRLGADRPRGRASAARGDPPRRTAGVGQRPAGRACPPTCGGGWSRPTASRRSCWPRRRKPPPASPSCSRSKTSASCSLPAARSGRA